MKILSKREIADFFGTSVEKLGSSFDKLYDSLDMSYELVQREEEEELILGILKRIGSDKQVVGSPERTDVWHNGWSENLLTFRETQNKSAITPKFIRPGNIIRLGGHFVRPSNPFFERDYAKLLQYYVYDNFITDDIENVYEFGCGSGFNLLNLAAIKPELNLYGSDFVNSSVELVNEVGSHFDLNIKAELFNMLHPDYAYEIKENSCMFTHGSIEQLAGNVQNFINFAVLKKPKICFHLEPVVEVYDDTNLLDYLQIKFHLKRGYTVGLTSYLEKLQDEGKIKDFKCRRTWFGSKFMEGYTLISWRPA